MYPGQMKNSSCLPACSLLLAVLSLTSCNGQAQAPPAKARAGAVKSRPAGQPKLVKTQGTNEYANIHCSVLDNAGNLWFGTTGEGVYRYDGRRFTQFTEHDGLSSNTVWCALADHDGNIWFGTENGACRYDGKTIVRIPIAAVTSSFLSIGSAPGILGKNAVHSIMQDRAGQLWFGTSDGVFCYNGSVFTRFLDTPHLLNTDTLTLNDVQCMLQDQNGDIWFGSGPMAFEGLCRYDGKAITRAKLGGETWVRYLLADPKGGFWLGTRHLGAWRYNGRELTPFTPGKDRRPADHDLGLPLLVDKAGRVWLSGGEHDNGYGGAGGIWRYDGKSFTNFTTKDGLGDYSVWSMVQDRAGNIWIGTRNTGLYRYDGKTFTSFTE